MTRCYMRQKMRELEHDLEEEKMNGRQAAREAAKRIEELEARIAMDIKDIRTYNVCILHMINHGSPCDFCYDKAECESLGKDLTIGCDQWMVGNIEIIHDEKEGDPVESEGVLPTGADSGEGAETDQGESSAL